MHDGIVFAVLTTTLRPFRVTPVGPVHIVPPLKVVVELHGMIWRREDHRSGDKVLRRWTGKIFHARRTLCNGHIAGRADKPVELLDRDLGLVHPETIHVHTVPGLGVWKLVRAHPEFAARNPYHSFRRRAGRRRQVDSWCLLRHARLTIRGTDAVSGNTSSPTLTGRGNAHIARHRRRRSTIPSQRGRPDKKVQATPDNED